MNEFFIKNDVVFCENKSIAKIELTNENDFNKKSTENRKNRDSFEKWRKELAYIITDKDGEINKKFKDYFIEIIPKNYDNENDLDFLNNNYKDIAKKYIEILEKQNVN